MQKLEPHKQISMTKEMLGPILHEYGITDFSFEQINEGIENSSARIITPKQAYVLRVYSQGKKTDEDISFELEFKDFLRGNGIPIPKILQNGNQKEVTIADVSGLRWQAILMEMVEGQSVTTSPSVELVAELATYQARMHLLGVEFAARSVTPRKLWTDLCDSLAERIDVSAISDIRALELVARIKNYRYALPANLVYGYNHLDIDFDGNVITKDDRVMGIIDFDDVQYSPVVVCLGYTLQCVLDEQGEGAMWTYLHAYEAVRTLSEVEREVLPHVVFFRNYAIAAMRLLLTGDKDIQRILRLEEDIPRVFTRNL